MSTGALLKIRQRISDVLAAPVAEALAVARSQPVVHMDETSAPTGNADGANPDQRKGWLWVLVTPALTVFQQGLRRSRQAAEMLLGETFAGILVSDRYSVYSLLPNGRRQLCWAHIRRDLIAIVERSGASAQIGAVLLDLQRQLFDHWYQWRDGLIAWPELQQRCGPIRRQFEAQLEAAADLGCARKETTPVARTVGTCRELLKAAPALWTFLDHQGVEPTNNAAERALRLAVIQRKISHGVQSARGALCRARLLTVTTSLRQQGRDVWEFLEQAWVAHRHGGVMPSLVPDEIRQGSVATLAVND
jgi:transposase